MTNQVRVGVVGVGSLGWHHARLYGECPQAELIGVYDVNPDNAGEVAKRLGVTAFDDLHALADAVDALSVAVPTDLHAEIGTQLLQLGKHLLIEKPITKTVQEGRALLDLADRKGLVVQVGHVERFNPVIAYLEEQADDPRFIETLRLAPYPPPRPGMLPRGTEVGVIFDLMIHDIDLILTLVKSPVAKIDAIGIPVLSQTEDIANARIQFENGCVANLTASRVTPEPMRKIRVFQSNTYISLDYQKVAGEIVTKRGDHIHREAVPIHPHNALLKELEDFVACVHTRREAHRDVQPKVTGIHGLHALEIATQIRNCF